MWWITRSLNGGARPFGRRFSRPKETSLSFAGNVTRHRPNGGYGLPVVDKIGDQHLLHVGADLGWLQVGEPVFAVADGVVRLSTGPVFDEKRKPGAARSENARSEGADKQSLHLTWGNLIVIEHHVAVDRYVTAIYGHLGANRLVQLGGTLFARGSRLVPLGGNTPRLTAAIGRIFTLGCAKDAWRKWMPQFFEWSSMAILAA